MRNIKDKVDNSKVNAMIRRALKTHIKDVPKDKEALEALGYRLEPRERGKRWDVCYGDARLSFFPQSGSLARLEYADEWDGWYSSAFIVGKYGPNDQGTRWDYYKVVAEGLRNINEVDYVDMFKKRPIRWASYAEWYFLMARKGIVQLPFTHRNGRPSPYLRSYNSRYNDYERYLKDGSNRKLEIANVKNELESERERLKCAEERVAEYKQSIESLEDTIENIDTINDENEMTRIIARGTLEELGTKIYSPDWETRYAFAKLGLPEDLDILVHDKDSGVRYAVAKQGRPEDLDILVHDQSELVRREVAEHGRPEDLSVLVNDKDKTIRIIAKEKLEESGIKIDSLDNISKDMSKVSKDTDIHETKGHKDPIR